MQRQILGAKRLRPNRLLAQIKGSEIVAKMPSGCSVDEYNVVFGLGRQALGAGATANFTQNAPRDMILRNAENIYPVEIEYRLDQNPAVRESAVYGVDHSQWGQEVKAVVVPEPGREISAEELAKWCGETLAAYKVPTAWEIRTTPLPRKPAGKVLKNVLAGEAANVRKLPPPGPPQTVRPVVHHVDRESVGLETTLDGHGQPFFVVDHEDPHGRSVPASEAPSLKIASATLRSLSGRSVHATGVPNDQTGASWTTNPPNRPPPPDAADSPSGPASA